MIDIPVSAEKSVARMQKWGAIASFLLVPAFILPAWIYLTGDLQHPLGPASYHLADFLYGPVWAAGFVTAILALREQIGAGAPRRMLLALLAATLAAGMLAAAAFIRSSNRQYHLIHPELALHESVPVLTVWTTLVAGVIAAGRHFMGWALVLLGSAGWTSRRLPPALCALYLVGGAASLFVYVLPDLDGLAVLLGIVWAVWQGILMWRAGSEEQSAAV